MKYRIVIIALLVLELIFTSCNTNEQGCDTLVLENGYYVLKSNKQKFTGTVDCNYSSDDEIDNFSEYKEGVQIGEWGKSNLDGSSVISGKILTKEQMMNYEKEICEFYDVERVEISIWYELNKEFNSYDKMTINLISREPIDTTYLRYCATIAPLRTDMGYSVFSNITVNQKWDSIVRLMNFDVNTKFLKDLDGY